MVLRTARLPLALCIAAASSMAMAGDIKFNGFASVVSGIDLSDDNALTAGGEAYTNDTVDNLQESRLGLQVTAPLGDDVRFIGQAIARGNAETGFVSNYEWAYLDYNVGDSGKFKAGRMRIPFYKYSDYLDVGYAYHWITPPKSMYSLAFSNVDGLGYSQNFAVGGMDMSVNTVFGRYQGNLRIAGQDAPGDLQNLGAINFTMAMGNHEFYAAYAQADVYIDSALVTGMITQIQTLTVSDIDDTQLLVDGDNGTFFGLGYKGAIGDIGLYAEASQVKVQDSLIQDSTGGYLGASYNMGSYLVHLTYEMQISDTKKGDGMATGGAAAAADTAITNTLRGLNGRAGEGDASTMTLGLRKDLGTSNAIKFEVSQYDENRYQDKDATDKSKESATLVKVAFEAMF
ncbi:MAG: hypothetical protein H7A09_03585 [Oceanospirillaceae bacterium]|nr:hypothetical protein [Oceanospirillaceae bacterium]MCP5335879.1 hypothetical protein [Oceanospirillaceae bacterium]MCP5350353.1 hypothetical protein [Oceanospirillaceae bacterium]